MAGFEADRREYRFYCWGPSKSPMEMTPNEQHNWNAHLQTPVIFNHHEPITVNSSTIRRIDMNPILSTPNAASNNERVLILTPLRDAARYLEKHFDLLSQLTYPHKLIDLGFLVGDSSDDTLAVLASEVKRIQDRHDSVSFNDIVIVEKDFGAGEIAAMTVEERHSFEAQGPRRKAMGKARNYLLSAALKPEHSWVYWRDVDIVESAPEILEDFIAHDKDVLVPNVWFHKWEDQNGEKVHIDARFDYNSWVESEQGLKLAASLPKDTVLAEGYKQMKTGRRYMALEGDKTANKDEEMELDGIGGVNIVVKADVHKSGEYSSLSFCSALSFCSDRTSGLCLNFCRRSKWTGLTKNQASTSHATPSKTKPRPRASRKWLSVLDTKLLDFQTTLSGTLIPRRSLETHKRFSAQKVR